MTKFVLLASAAIVGASGAAMSAVEDDPYIWLEEFTSPRVDQWIAAHNAPTFAELEADPRYRICLSDPEIDGLSQA